MFGDYKVVSATLAGRKRYLEILVPYLLRERGLIDRHEWWVNTADADDLAYLCELTAAYPDFFEIVPAPGSDSRAVEPATSAGRSEFYTRCIDPHTIYLKLNDDICYLEAGAVEVLLTFRVANPQYFLVYPGVVNSALMSHVHQRQGAIPIEAGFADYNPYGRIWHDVEFGAVVHREFLKARALQDVSRWHFKRFELNLYELHSTHFICWSGADFATFQGHIEGDAEPFLSCVKPRELGRINCVCGQSVAVHFAYHTQRDYLEAQGLLRHYRSLSKQLAAPT